jgi:translation elongation factor EF-G
VLNKRRAIILDEELNENSNLFMIKAHLPLIESFGFYSEIIKKTSGRVSS